MSNPSYKTNDPRGWGGDPTRGAALGRPTVQDAPKETAKKLTMQRVRLDSGGDSGGYDHNGTYFGIGAPLYWVADEEGEIDFMLRAGSRESAKEKVRETYPRARFHR